MKYVSKGSVERKAIFQNMAFAKPKFTQLKEKMFTHIKQSPEYKKMVHKVPV